MLHGTAIVLQGEHAQLSIATVNVCRRTTSDCYGNIVQRCSCVVLN